ncbi:hypothetical protein SUGI_0290310 [Cryptomeria japonica]|nr:hypothetical protein SUGI_0290310 [Cryptomeria japonica]
MDNHLSGIIPSQLDFLPNLELIVSGYNNLTGTIPNSLGNIFSLDELDLGNNQFHGTVSWELGMLDEVSCSLRLPNLELIVSGFNNLTGTIPNSLGNIFSLDQLDLGNNQFHGTVSWELGMLDEVSFLALNVNHLTGQNPSSSNRTVLEVLDINDNNITEEITGELFSKTTNLMELYLAINQLTGSLPVSLFTCSQLEQLEVSGNRLSGTVPTELGKLYRLIWLNLGSNQFTSGSKSTLRILTALANCSLLEVILLSGNHLTGVIPSSVGQLSTKSENWVWIETK